MTIEEIIETSLRDINYRIKNISGLDNRVGFVVGGTEFDPINKNAYRPFVWIIFTGDSPIDTTTECLSVLDLNFTVKVAIDYDNEENLINTQLPLLYTLIDNIKGQEAVPGSQWEYKGQFLSELDSDRQIWEQQYSLGISF